MADNKKRLGVLTEKQFELVKLLTDHNLKRKEIASIIGASPASVSTWTRFETWKDYCQYKQELVEKLHQKQQEKKAQKPIKVVTEVVEAQPVEGDLMEHLLWIENGIRDILVRLNEIENRKKKRIFHL